MKQSIKILVIVFLMFMGINSAFANKIEFKINNQSISWNPPNININELRIQVESNHLTIVPISNPYIEGINSYTMEPAPNELNIELIEGELENLIISGGYKGYLKNSSGNKIDNITINEASNSDINIKEGKYGNIVVNSGKVTISGGTFEGSSTSDYLFTNNGGTLVINDGTFNGKLLVYNTNDSATTLYNGGKYIYLPESPHNHQGKFIHVEKGKMTIKGGTISFNNSNPTSCGILVDATGQLDILGSTIKMDNSICNSGTMNYGGTTDTNNPKTFAYGLSLPSDGAKFNMGTGYLYLKKYLEETNTDNYIFKIGIQKPKHVLQSDVVTDNDISYHKYYLEDQTKWEEFKESFKPDLLKESYKILLNRNPFLDINDIEISVSVDQVGGNLQILSSVTIPKSDSNSTEKKYTLESDLSYDKGVVTYSDNYNKDITLNAENEEEFLIKTSMATIIFANEMYFIGELNKYDIDKVMAYIEDNYEKLTIDKDGISLSIVEKEYTFTDGNDEVTRKHSTFTDFKLDILNGIKTLPKEAYIVDPSKEKVTESEKMASGNDEEPSKTEPKTGEQTSTTETSKKDVDVDADTDTGVEIPILVISLLVGSCYIIKNKTNTKLFKI